MNLGRTGSVALCGLEGALVDVEAHIAGGLPQLVVTGLPDKACGQAPDRVRSALASAGQAVPPHRVTVNLSPASIPKVGTGFDLAIAVTVLAASGVVPPALVREVVHIGELGLDGRLKPVRGVLPMVLSAVRAGRSHIVVPAANAAEAQLVDGAVVHAAPDLATVLSWYAAARSGEPLPVAAETPGPDPAPRRRLDLSEVVGQEQARFALELAAVGGHHLHLSGPPGAGKTMLAERLVTILPTLTREEALQTHAIRSLVGAIDARCTLDLTPPFVAPHHTASMPAIVGGGPGAALPGAVSRAHLGVLFLDEAPEFAGPVLQTLRQPLESGEVVLARARQVVRYPARFQLVLASNPCPCGNAGTKGACICGSAEVRRYLGRLSGPLLDRVDLQVEVRAVTLAAFAEGTGESSAAVAARVLVARHVQRDRWSPQGWALNGEVPGHVLRRAPFRLGRRATSYADRALDQGRLTLRGYDRVLRLAWSAADVSGLTVPGAEEVGLALALRAAPRAAA